MVTLEERVRRLEDQVAIRELVAVYGQILDDRDFIALATLFTCDASFDDGRNAYRGRDTIVRYYRDALAIRGATYHYPHAHHIAFVDPANATGMVNAHAELAIDGETYWVAIRYSDEYGIDDATWRFRSRTLRMLYAMKLSELPSGLGTVERLRWPGGRAAPAHWGAS